jgi:hypothetical protein
MRRLIPNKAPKVHDGHPKIEGTGTRSSTKRAGFEEEKCKETSGMVSMENFSSAYVVRNNRTSEFPINLEVQKNLRRVNYIGERVMTKKQ